MSSSSSQLFSKSDKLTSDGSSMSSSSGSSSSSISSSSSEFSTPDEGLCFLAVFELPARSVALRPISVAVFNRKLFCAVRSCGGPRALSFFPMGVSSWELRLDDSSEETYLIISHRLHRRKSFPVDMGWECGSISQRIRLGSRE